MHSRQFEQEIAMNRTAYERIREQIQQEHAGQYVAIARGRLISAAPSYDEALAAIQRLEPVPECYFIFPAEEEPVFEVVTDYFGGR